MVARGVLLLLVFDEEMLAEPVEGIGVEPRLIGAFEALAEFEIEDAEAQTACGFAIFSSLSKAQSVTADVRVNARRRIDRRMNGRESGSRKFSNAGSRNCRLNRSRGNC